MRLRITAPLLVAMVLFPAGSWAQAAAEYGLAAGKSAAATAGAASVLNKANRRLTDAIGQRTTSAATASKSQARTPKAARGAAPQNPPAATQLATANAGTAAPPSSALMIETGKGTITIGEHGTLPTKAESAAPPGKSTATRPATQNRYDSVITLPVRQ